MTEDVSAGRLHLDAYIDTTGVTRGLQRRLDAETKAIRARIKAEIDTRGTIATAKRAAGEASKAAKVRLKAEIDTRGLVAQVKAACVAASQAAVVKVRTELDQASAASTAAAIAALSRDAQVSVDVEADTARARAEIERVRASAKKPVKIPVDADTKKANVNLGKTIAQVSKLPMMVGGIYTLASAVVQLGGGLIAMGSAAAQSIGILAALPNLAGIAAQAIGSLIIGFSGVGDAVGELVTQQTAATGSTSALAAAQKAAARNGAAQAIADARRAVADARRGVADAQRAVADARHQAADAKKAAKEAIADALWSRMTAREDVKDAQRDLRDARKSARETRRDSADAIAGAEKNVQRALENTRVATENVSKARIAARKYIDDVTKALARSRLEEKAATNDLADAREHLAEVNADPTATAKEKRDAEQAVAEAQAQLSDTVAQGAELEAAEADARKKGIEGSDLVLAAKEDLAAATEAEQEAEENLAQTRIDAAEAAKDALRAIRDAKRGTRDATHAEQEAEEALAQARHDAADQAKASARAIADAQRAVADAQRRVGDAVRGVAQARQSAALAAMSEAAAVESQTKAFDGLSPAAQRFATFIANTLRPRWLQLRDAVASALLPPVQEGIEAAMPLLDTLETGLVGSARIIGNLIKRVGELFGSKGFNTDVGKIMGSNNRALKDFGDAIFNVIQFLRHLAVVAGPTLVEPFAKWVDSLTRGWKEAAKTGRETGKLREILKTAGDRAKQVKDILSDLGGVLFDVGKAASGPGGDLLTMFGDWLDRLHEWTSSDEGQKKMTDFFEATKPLTEEFGKLVRNVGKFLINMSQDGGAASGFLKTLNLIVTGLNKLFEIPGAGPAIGGLMALAGVGGALGFVAGKILGIGTNIKKIGKATGLTALVKRLRNSESAADGASTSLGSKFKNAVKSAGDTAKAAGSKIAAGARAAKDLAVNVAKAGWAALVATGRWIAHAAAVVASKVASVVASAATKAWTGIQIAFNFVMSMNPLVAVGLALILLVGLLVLAYKKSETFRNIVDGAFRAVREVVESVVGWFEDHVVPFFTDTLPGAFKATKEWVKKNWPVILAILTGPIGLAVLAITKNWDKITGAFKAAKNWVVNTWKAGWDKVKGWVSGPIDAARSFISTTWGKITSGFTGVKNWVVNNFKAAWAKVEGWISGPIDLARAAIKMMLGDQKPGIQYWFSEAVKGIGTIWAGLQALAKAPVKFVVNTVFNNGLRKMINAIPGIPDLPEITLPAGFKRGGVLPGYTPNRDVHQFTSPTGGAFEFSGGEAIMRPEWTKAIGTRTVNAWNAAAARGKGALQRALGGGPEGHSTGGILPAMGRRLGYFLGGVLPLDNATASAHSREQYPFAQYAGDLNYGSGYDDYGKPIKAWKAGTAQPFDYGSDTSYGRGVVVQHPSQSTLYAHMSRIAEGIAGQVVRAGQTIGFVGDYGNTGTPPTSHLHFEVRGGNIDLGDGAGAGISPEEAKGEEEADGWRAAISKIKDLITSAPDWAGALGKLGEWGGMAKKAVGNVGGQLVQWINDKIPDKIVIPHFPDIPLPNNPIGNVFSIFDQGGSLMPGSTYAVNNTGKVETVFTNDQMVKLSSTLAAAAQALKATITVDGATGRPGALVEHLELTAREDQMSGLLDEAMHRLRVIQYGGVHAKRPE